MNSTNIGKNQKTLDLKLSLGINMTVSQENNNVNELLGG